MFAVGLLVTACFELLSSEGNASLRIIIDRVVTDVGTRASATDAIPDTDDFILTVLDGDDREIYSGRFGDSPEAMLVQPGVYTISAVSKVLEGPAYDSPVYGDVKVVVVGDGEQATVALTCSMANCGVKLNVEKGLRTAFPLGTLYISDSCGSLMHSYDETRTSYVQPGEMTITLAEGGNSRVLLRRQMTAKQMLTLNLSASASAVADGGGLSIGVDTSRDWTNDRFVVGADNGGGDAAGNAMSVAEARAAALSGTNAGKKVWVSGYIVGCATSSTKIEFSEPFTKSTNIILGDRSVSSNREYCLSVELPSGLVRDALSLPEHPWLHGQRVTLCGILSPSYFDLPALKSVSAYEFAH